MQTELVISAPAVLAPVMDMLRACIQCGTCTGSCPNAFAMDHTPRKLWRMLMMGQKEAIFQSQTFYLCSSCYTCTLRCPRGLPLTEAMSALKAIAAKENLAPYRQSTCFYKQFLRSVCRHGRVRETELVALYFLDMKRPLLPFQHMALGIKLMRKGKLTLQFLSRGKGKLEALFQKSMGGAL